MSERFSGLLRCCSVHAKGYTSNLDCTRPEVLTREKSKVDSTYCTTLILKKKNMYNQFSFLERKRFQLEFHKVQTHSCWLYLFSQKAQHFNYMLSKHLNAWGIDHPPRLFPGGPLEFFFFFQTAFLKMPVSMVIRSFTLYLEKIKWGTSTCIIILRSGSVTPVLQI